MELHTLVSLRFKEYRRKASLTQHAMASLLAIPLPRYRGIELGTRRLGLEPEGMHMVSKFCTALDITIAEFMAGHGNHSSREAELLQLHWDILCKELEVIKDIEDAVAMLKVAAKEGCSVNTPLTPLKRGSVIA